MKLGPWLHRRLPTRENFPFARPAGVATWRAGLLDYMKAAMTAPAIA